jgi:hypothetical protein
VAIPAKIATTFFVVAFSYFSAKEFAFRVKLIIAN